jgi:uncharacterized membrane protein
MGDWSGLALLTVSTALGCGVIAGAFFVFSAFVMRGLASLPPARGIAAMQAINSAAYHPAFLGVFAAAAVGCVAVIGWSLVGLFEPGAVPRVSGAGLYLFGAVLLTGIYHVPRNDSLADLDPSAPVAARAWDRYVEGWTAWNHVRALTAVAGTALLLLSLR